MYIRRPSSNYAKSFSQKYPDNQPLYYTLTTPIVGHKPYNIIILHPANPYSRRQPLYYTQTTNLYDNPYNIAWQPL